MPLLSERLPWISLLAPFGAAVYLGFSAGGFFAGSTAVGVLVLLAVLALRVLTEENPFAGVNLWVVVVSATLAVFAVWVLISYIWSDSPARSLLEFDRALLYLLAFLAAGSVLSTSNRVRGAVWGATAATVAITGVGLLTRIFPDVFPTDPAVAADRLSHPLTYWNGLGLMAVFGLVLTLGIASDRRQPAVARPIAAALTVPLAATLYFTLSRGAIAACALGLVVFVVMARPRPLITTLPAVLPFVAVALLACYQADTLTTRGLRRRQRGGPGPHGRARDRVRHGGGGRDPMGAHAPRRAGRSGPGPPAGPAAGTARPGCSCGGAARGERGRAGCSRGDRPPGRPLPARRAGGAG